MSVFVADKPPQHIIYACFRDVYSRSLLNLVYTMNTLMNEITHESDQLIKFK